VLHLSNSIGASGISGGRRNPVPDAPKCRNGVYVAPITLHICQPTSQPGRSLHATSFTRRRHEPRIASAVRAGCSCGPCARVCATAARSSRATLGDLAGLPLLMNAPGGMRSLTGAVVGTLAISAIRELLRAFERGFGFAGTTVQIPQGTQEIVLALALLLILVLRPQGIVGDYELGVSPPR
jgi:hypothetical protein